MGLDMVGLSIVSAKVSFERDGTDKKKSIGRRQAFEERLGISAGGLYIYICCHAIVRLYIKPSSHYRLCMMKKRERNNEAIQTNK